MSVPEVPPCQAYAPVGQEIDVDGWVGGEGVGQDRPDGGEVVAELPTYRGEGKTFL